MSRKPKKGDFQVGNPGGPGKPPLPPELKEAQAYTRVQLISAITKYIVMPLSDLMVLAKDNSLSAIDHMIMRIIINGIQKGDHQRMEVLLDRIQGKVKQVIENVGDKPVRDVARLDDLHKELVMLIVGQSQGLLGGS